ncbi:hypothetical protein MF271_22255 (plasmid) [Deinococcus sp. KNUC1210]|uniref:hypothetical protein n=1 Tax=Deinococcus sp. KNUC1210 TaxID=2917691 RepID=UPI001EF03377|nr:hypothetical protein [Deinococcus sp. KNUC1210]ULH18195.1 hypothetical protein MF271_22255 [Deinococcus sp. KNUC1210]
MTDVSSSTTATPHPLTAQERAERLALWSGLEPALCLDLPAQMEARIARKRPQLVRLIPEVGNVTLTVHAATLQSGAQLATDVQTLQLPGYRLEPYVTHDTPLERACRQIDQLLETLEETFGTPEGARVWLRTSSEDFHLANAPAATPLAQLQLGHPRSLTAYLLALGEEASFMEEASAETRRVSPSEPST